jgi:hypothetical protein
MLLATYYHQDTNGDFSGPYTLVLTGLFPEVPGESVDYVRVRSLTRREARLARLMEESAHPAGLHQSELSRRTREARRAFHDALPPCDRHAWAY